MRQRLLSWGGFIKNRWRWLFYFIFYKLAEDWALDWAREWLANHSGGFVSFLTWGIDYLPILSWTAIPIVIVILLVKTWTQTRQHSFATLNTSSTNQKADSTQYAQANDILSTLIGEGKKLADNMQRDDFHKGLLGQEARQWLDKTEHDVWDVIPEHANILTDNQVSAKEPYTDQEKLRYAGWDRNAAAIRVSVDRRLARLREIRSRIPVTSTEPSQDLSHEQVAENLTFIQQLRAVVERLLKNSQGAETRSIKSIAHDICSETPVREYIASDGLAGQTDRLLTHQLDDFFIRVSNYQRQVEGLSVGNLDDTNINSICNTIRELVFDYRRLVDEVMVMLTNLENRGVEALWHKTPWSVRIHRELADNYDELMRLVVDLKTVTPSYARDLLPKDDQTSKFKRGSLLSGKGL